MKSFRKFLFWCHLTAGVTAGIVILIMSVTGVLLAYEKQIISWADTRSYRVTQPTPQAARLPVETLLARLREREPAAPATITRYADATRPVAIGFAGGRTLYVNPYTGEVFGEGSPKVRAFFRSVTDWHRWLGASNENRAIGRAVTGASNLIFLFIVTSGFYLWWPRKLNWKQLRSILWFRRGLRSRARDFNWHNVVGIWSLVPLFIVVLSAVVISYTWASNLVYRLAGEAPPAPVQRSAPPPQQAATAEKPLEGGVSLEGLENLWARAEQQVEGWRSITMQMPVKAEAPVTFTIDQGNGGQPQKRAQLALNRTTGEVVRWEPFSSYTTGRRLRSYLRFAHTGEVAGIVGQTIAALVSLGGAVLVFTGLLLAARRLRAWLARRLPATTAQVASEQTEG